MHQSSALRAMSLAAIAVLAAACTSTGERRQAAVRPAAAPAAPALEGKAAAYCPRVTLRDGTAILRKRAGDDLEYVASVTATNRDCRIVDGQLRMKIGVAGRLVSGPAGKAGNVALPIRIAIVQGTDVIYSRQGSQSVALKPGDAPGEFIYVDNDVSVPEPTAKNLVVYAGFDEGPGR